MANQLDYIEINVVEHDVVSMEIPDLINRKHHHQIFQYFSSLPLPVFFDRLIIIQKQDGMSNRLTDIEG